MALENPHLDFLAKELAAWVADKASIGPMVEAVARGSSGGLPSLVALEERVARKLVARMASGGLTVITGGPGTGKTTMITGMVEEALRKGVNSRLIALAAPTGKAAARMAEALTAKGVGVPRDTLTLHRLLGYQSLSGRARHHEGHPLPHELVIVDEVSMADLWLFDALLAAVGPGTRLVLVGDADQLPSVRAGSVLKDILASGVCEGSVVRLTERHRLAGAGTSGAVMVSAINAVTAGDVAALRHKAATWNAGPWPSEPGVWLREGEGLQKVLESWRTCHWTSELLTHHSLDHAPALLKSWEKFRLLCARRTGPLGVERLNALLHAQFARLTGQGSALSIVAGEPLVAVHSDERRGIANGDPAVALRMETADGFRLVAAFLKEGAVVTYPLEALGDTVALAHAVSVHKSQGSEYDCVLLVLPEATSPLACREVLYTGLTRARRQAVVVAPTGSLDMSCIRTLEREGGLAAALRRAAIRKV